MEKKKIEEKKENEVENEKEKKKEEIKIECPHCNKGIKIEKWEKILVPSVKAEKNIYYKSFKDNQTKLDLKDKK